MKPISKQKKKNESIDKKAKTDVRPQAQCCAKVSKVVSGCHD